MNLNQLRSDREKEFDEEIPERILNADNPQYVLGWNASRYLSKSFNRQSEQMIIDWIKEWAEKNKGCSVASYFDEDADANRSSGYNEALSDLIKELNK